MSWNWTWQVSTCSWNLHGRTGASMEGSGGCCSCQRQHHFLSALARRPSFTSRYDYGISRFTLFKVSVVAGTHSLSPINVGPLKPLPFRASVVTGTPPHVHLLRDSVYSLTHWPVSGSDTICDGPSPTLADIVLLRLSPSSFSSKILKRLY